MIKDKTKDVFPKRCRKCFYKSQKGDYCYIKEKASSMCPTFTKIVS